MPDHNTPHPGDPAAAPALWNPNIAACLSFFLTPVFGAYLLMLNWRALGRSDEAASAKNWFLANLAACILYFLAGFAFKDAKSADVLVRVVGLGMLISWYLGSARHQVQFVKARYGQAYPKRSWLHPRLIAAGIVIGILALAFLAGTAASGLSR